MTGLDEFRLAMTGGDRYIDTATQTVLQRTYQSGQGGTGNFRQKSYSGAGATPYPSTAVLTIDNQGQGTQMQVTLGGTGTAQCANPRLSGSAFICDLTMQNTNEIGSCTSWTGDGSSGSPYKCSTFGAFAGVGTPSASTPGTTSTVTTTASGTETVTCSGPSGSSSSNFTCATLTDTQNNPGSCSAWIGNGTSTSPFSCSNFSTFGGATFTVSSQAAAQSYSETAAPVQTTSTTDLSSCTIQKTSPFTITCPLNSTPARTVTCIPSGGDGTSKKPYYCKSTDTFTISGLPAAIKDTHTNSTSSIQAPLPKPAPYFKPPKDVTYTVQAQSTYWYVPSYTGSASAALYYYSTYALTFGGSLKYYVRAEVCQPNPVSGTFREENCVRYGTSSYKPVGEVQRNGEKMRFGVFSYYNANDIDNAVMRSKLKDVAPLKWSSSGASVANSIAEWSATDGTLLSNPDPTEASGSYPSAVSKSGVINYINQFGTVSQKYKTYDNVGKLYYESLRYLRGLQPTTAFYTRATAASADGFPIISSWDSSTEDPVKYWCQKNFIITMGDVHTHCDKRLPGGTSTGYGAGQCAAQNSQAADQGSLADSGVNVGTLTNALGTLEGRPTLADTFGFAGSASFYMSGLAYGAAKDGFRNMSKTINGVTQAFRSKPRLSSSTSRNTATRATPPVLGSMVTRQGSVLNIGWPRSMAVSIVMTPAGTRWTGHDYSRLHRRLAQDLAPGGQPGRDDRLRP